MYSSCDDCVYSLTKSEAKYKEMKDTKEKEIVDLRNELAKLHTRCVQYVCQCPHMSHYLRFHPPERYNFRVTSS